MKSWTLDLNLHFSLAGTPFCVFSLLVCPFFLLVSFLAFVTCHACHIYLACLLCDLVLLSTLFPSIAFLLVFLSLPLHGHIWSKDTWSQGMISQVQEKRARMRARGQVKRLQSIGLGVQPFPFGYVLFKPPPYSSLSPLDGLYQVYHALYYSSSSLEYGVPYLFSCTYILGHALGMQAFTFLLCVLSLCMMQVYIYLFAPLWCDCHSLCHLRQAMSSFCRKSKVTCHWIFAAKIWYLARLPQESIDWDHTFSNAKLQSPHAYKALEANAKIMFYSQSPKIKVL